MRLDIGFPYDPKRLATVNMNHLLYFWTVVRCGSITRASAALGIAQPTVSEQLRRLEEAVKCRLLSRGARGVSPTPEGEIVMRYAEELVGVCGDLLAALPLDRPVRRRPLIVGTADAVPKLVVRRILDTLTDETPELNIISREWRIDHLLSELSLHRLDMVISDAAVTGEAGSNLASFLAGSSTVSVLGTASRVRSLRSGFPESLHDFPFGMPATGATLRESLDRWFEQRNLTPRTIFEAEDRSHLYHFASCGLGAIPASTMIAPELCKQFGLAQVGELADLHEQYFVMMVPHHHQHPAAIRLRDRLSHGPILNA